MSMPGTSATIQMRGVAKIFRVGRVENQVLTDVHLTVHRGDFLTIAGPSGCGKTTLLSLMGLLDTVSAGELLLDGISLHGIGRAERAQLRNRHIGFIFQAVNLIAGLDVFENVALPLSYRTDMGRAERRERAADALARVGMAHRMYHYPAQLSGGQQQRVGVARALAGDPAILLADEPTGNLDTANGERIMALISSLHADGRTVCVVTHEERFRSVADRTVRLLDGRVVDETTYAEWRREKASGLDTPTITEPF